MADARATPAQDSQAKKGELSYHYWHGRNAGEAPAATAKKITEAEANALAAGLASTQVSAWNAAGTWEERGHTDWARARLEALLCVEHDGFIVADAAAAGFVGGGDDEGGDVRARVTSVKSCEGDASVVMIRGKPKHGFDFELKLDWSATFACEGGASGDDDEDSDGEAPKAIKVKGTIVVPEASRDVAEDEECYFEVKVDDRKPEHKTKEDMCVKVLKAHGEAFLVKALKTLDAELRERASS